MKQTRLNFDGTKGTLHAKVKANPEWPAIIHAQPERYPGMMQTLALRALHRAGKPHRQHDCDLYRQRPGVSA